MSEIEHDPHDHSRQYIPLPGGWEVQTRGQGSSFRLLDKKTGERHVILSGKDWKPLQDFFTRFARELFEACRAPPATPSPAPAAVDWRDDPSADERWSAGCNFAMTQLCRYLKIDPAAVSWDAATETLDGDVSSVIGNILRAHFGEEWGPSARAALSAKETT